MTIDKGIFIKNIFHMLAYAFSELRSENYERIAVEDFEEIHDLFAEILAKGIAYQLKQGLHREYVERQDSLNTLRGKLDLNGTLRNFAANKRQLDCTFDELSEDNLFNQILKSTTSVLLSHPFIKSKRKVALRRLMLFFENVSYVDLKAVRWTALRFDRNSKTYQMLLYFCYFVASEFLMTTDEGEYKLQHFLSDEKMERLFERFVLEYYRRHHPTLHAEARQIDWNINKTESNTEHLPILQTDIMLHVGERTLIIDTKYYQQILQQHFDRRILHNSNVHQIHTYVTNCDECHTGFVDGMLLYAKTEEQIIPNEYIQLKDGNRIFFRTLDLNQEFKEIKKQLDEIISVY